MPNTLVSSTATLVRALQTAKSGDVIMLASGNYSGVVLQNIKLAGNVTITSADATSRAVLTDLKVRDSTGLTFTGLDFTPKETAPIYSFSVYHSDRISFDQITLAGPNNLGSGHEQSAFLIRLSQNISVTNSEFHHLWHGVSVLDTKGVTLTGNYFHDIRTDGIRGGGNSSLVVSGNLFTDFYPAAGDHPDAIQLWTTNTTESARDITISDNVVLRGEGAAVQGIFIRDQLGDLPYVNVSITNNLVVGGMYNGIAIGHVQGGDISGNMVLAAPDQRSWIMVAGDTGVTVSDNVASDMLFTNDAAARGSTNSYALAVQDGGIAALSSWLGARGTFKGAWGEGDDVWGAANLAEPEHQLTVEVNPMVRVTGTSGNDRLAADTRFDSRVEAGEGADVITGGLRTAELVGGAGNDTYQLRSAGDQVIEIASGGYDTVSVAFSYTLTANVEALRMTGSGQAGTGNALDNRIVGSASDDRISGLGGDDSAQGGAGNDTIDGGTGNDTLRGEAGADTLRGGDGDDVLAGNEGNDSLDGGIGADLIEGGTGNDLLTGGAGADSFRYRSADVTGGQRDRIADFARGVDELDLGLVDANSRTATNDAFKFIATQAFGGTAGELRYEVSGGAAHVQGDLNGDRVADFTISLTGVSALSAADLVL